MSNSIFKPSGILFLSIISVLFLHGITSCRSTLRAPMPEARSFAVEQREIMLADSLQGFVAMPNSAVRIRTTFNADTIFAEIRTNDTITLRSMLVNGLSIWFDPQQKQNQKFGLSFPAARSEMLRRQNEIETETVQMGEKSVTLFRFVPQQWVDAISNREVVITDNKGTRFADRRQAKFYIDSNGDLVYNIRIAFSQLGTTLLEAKRLSIGVVSEPHQAIPATQQGGGGVATRPNITDRNRQPSERPQQPQFRLMLIPVKTWMIFNFTSESTSEPEPQKVTNDPDDVYNPRR